MRPEAGWTRRPVIRDTRSASAICNSNRQSRRNFAIENTNCMVQFRVLRFQHLVKLFSLLDGSRESIQNEPESTTIKRQLRTHFDIRDSQLFPVESC